MLFFGGTQKNAVLIGIVSSLFFLSACSPQNSSTTQTQASSCGVSQDSNGALISCSNGSSAYVNNGTVGQAGHSAHSLSFNIIAADSATCANGGQIIMIATDSNDNGVLDSTDENIQTATICNGTNGTNGVNGVDGQNAPPTAFTPVAMVNPCGDAPGIYDEVFLRLANGTMLASFSDSTNGYNTRFSVLTPGTYMTTDGDHCVFNVDTQGNITNENHHY